LGLYIYLKLKNLLFSSFYYLYNTVAPLGKFMYILYDIDSYWTYTLYHLVMEKIQRLSNL